MNLPTQQECLGYFEQYKVPSNIKSHCLKVTEVAVFLAKRLQQKGLPVNAHLVTCAALMHDLFKVVVLEKLEPCEQYHPEPYSEEELVMWRELRQKYPNMYESEVAYEIFKDEFPKLALVVKNSSDPKNRNKTWEELIVHYADWRISGEQIIVLDKRLAYLKERYPRTDNAWDEYSSVIKGDEQKIFSHLPFTPEQLKEKLDNEQ